MRTAVKRVLSAVAVATAVAAVPAGPAWAEYDDSYTVWTTDRCGSIEFVDYGEGVPGSGGYDNDYILVRDHCDDGYEVKADVWFAFSWLGTRYQAGGPAAGPLFWDPFERKGYVVGAGDMPMLTVCLYDRSDPEFNLGFNCEYEQRAIVD